MLWWIEPLLITTLLVSFTCFVISALLALTITDSDIPYIMMVTSAISMIISLMSFFIYKAWMYYL